MKSMDKQWESLARFETGELRDKYAQLFGQTTNTRNRVWLIRRIAWRLQVNAQGGLSPEALQRARQLAQVAEVRSLPPHEPSVEQVARQSLTNPLPAKRDPRLPPVGSVIKREYRGKMLLVKVLADGFEFAGEVFGSLSAVAKRITGSHCNGFHFFQLKGERP